jgi:6-phosphofructokinase 1
MDSAGLSPRDFDVPVLGAPTYESPLPLSSRSGDGAAHFVPEDARVALDVEHCGEPSAPTRLLEKAGPRRRLFFDPSRARAAIVTCGGLCPGINNVVRAIVLELHHRYGVGSVLGFRYGYEGLDPAGGVAPVPLAPADVRSIHRDGGSVLGLSRGRRDVAALVDVLVAREVEMLFAVGGDGTLHGARAIHEEIARRGRPIAVVGVPKTIDNDVPYVDKTFGFDTAVEHARAAIDAAHVEATGARNGVGLVKLMGRDSGFIAAAATLASDDVNVCLVPEVPFSLDGVGGLLDVLERRLASRGHAVIVVAEGCASALAMSGGERDASGNLRYGAGGADVGCYLRDAIEAHFQARRVPLTLKYIDPSYMIRSVPANAADAILCDALGRHAVHAAMAGRTGIVLGRVHGVFTHVPLAVVTRQRKRIDPEGAHWLSVLEATGQPPLRAHPACR